MSNSVFQSVIVQLKDVTDRVFGVIDTEGCVVSCTDMSLLGERWNDAALKVGFKRIGVGKTFIHLDDDMTLPQNVIWNYYE